MLLAIRLSIGRGHPLYLDLTLKELTIPYSLLSLPSLNARHIWNLLKVPYQIGSRGGIFTFIYNYLRSQRTAPKILLNIFHNNLIRHLPRNRGKIIILVSHPLLAASLKEDYEVYYLHGEVSCPKEGLVGAKKIFVPLKRTKEKFIKEGFNTDNIFVSGLFLEKELLKIKDEAYEARIERLKKGSRLTGAFFLSGAYPIPHIKKIINYAQEFSLKGIKLFLFAGTNPAFVKYFGRKLSYYGVEIIGSKNWQEEIEQTSKIFPRLDFFISAAHERVNWALGLGIPMFVLKPFIGPYARLNFLIAKEAGVALDEEAFRKILLTHSYQELLKMASCGYNKFPTDGAKKTAEFLSNLFK